MTISRTTITLDTNCIINLFDGTSRTSTSVSELADLFRHALSGKIEIAVTTRVEADLLQDRNIERQAGMLRHLAMLPVNGTVGRWDTSKWDGGDIYVGDDEIAEINKIQKILFPDLSPDDKRYVNKINDVDHLFGHHFSHRDIFVTDDRDIRRKGDQLQAEFGLVVMIPSECITHINRIYGIS